MSLSVARKTVDLVPAAAPIIVQALRAGPLTTKELWARCHILASETSASGSDKMSLNEVFKTKTDMKKRILPTLEHNAIISQHHLQYPQTRITDPSARQSMIIDKIVRKSLKKSKTATSSSDVASSSSSPANTSSSSKAASNNAEFVWSLSPYLLERSSQLESVLNPATREKIESRLERISSGTESVHAITSETRANLVASRKAYQASKIISLSTLQQTWARLTGKLDSIRFGESAEQWVTSEEERQHLNKRRREKRMEKEQKMVRFIKTVDEAYKGRAPSSS